LNKRVIGNIDYVIVFVMVLPVNTLCVTDLLSTWCVIVLVKGDKMH